MFISISYQIDTNSEQMKTDEDRIREAHIYTIYLFFFDPEKSNQLGSLTWSDVFIFKPFVFLPT